jgi:hypothetical protein
MSSHIAAIRNRTRCTIGSGSPHEQSEVPIILKHSRRRKAMFEVTATNVIIEDMQCIDDYTLQLVIHDAIHSMVCISNSKTAMLIMQNFTPGDKVTIKGVLYTIEQALMEGILPANYLTRMDTITINPPTKTDKCIRIKQIELSF